MRIHLYAAFLMLFVTASTVAFAGDQPQPLALKMARDVYKETNSAIRSQMLPTSAAGPEGQSLPGAASPSLRFAKWVTPLAKDGFLWMAIDGPSADAEYDTLYIDADAHGSLADETPVKAYEVKNRYSRFGPARVTFPGTNGPSEYYLNVDCTRYPGVVSAAGREPLEANLFVYSACWREGTVRIGEAEYKCTLFDYNGNGTFSDTSMDPEAMDRMSITSGDSAPPLGLGRFVRVSGTLYHPELRPDGAFIRFTPAVDVAMGTVRVNKDISAFSLTGENGQFVFDSNSGPVEVPAGKWIPESWRMERTDAKGQSWTLRGRRFSLSAVFEVPEGQEVPLDMGTLAWSTLSVGKIPGADGEYWFDEDLSGTYGELISLADSKNARVAPKLHIRNLAGTYDVTLPFEAG